MSPASPPPPEPKPRRTGFRLRRSEHLFLTFMLFPAYPWLRLLRFGMPRLFYSALMVLSAGLVTGLIWLVNKADKLWEYDDWRGMMKAGEFPFLVVFGSLCAAGFVCLCAARFVHGVADWRASRAGPKGPRVLRGVFAGARLAICAGAIACLGLASWPFWGWGHVNKNVFARTIEHSDRHEFELGFLHWLLDFDGDGYAALLHGGDPDDWNAEIQSGGIPPLHEIAVPMDEFEIADPAKAERCPNVVIFFLEGVTPRSVSAYGMRRLSGGAKATPSMDGLAEDGALFTQARCVNPSTWDAWFMVNAGRYLRIKEMDASQPFHDRYSRYNNLLKVLKLARVNRWCHANTAPYADLFVTGEDRLENWQEDFDSTVTKEEEDDREIWRGDKRVERMLEFVDSVKPGERFFISEHFTDSHFPWRRTSDSRAAELGFPDGLGFVEEDAILEGETNNKFACYYQTVARVDGQIGAVVKRIKERGLYDETLFVVVSDHGCQWYEHEHAYYVSHLYEQCLRVPLIVKAPGIAGGIVSDAAVLQVDVLPTIMELAGIRLAGPDPGRPVPGRSLLPLMKGFRDGETLDRFRLRDLLLTTHYDRIGAVSQFRHKLVFDRPTGTYWLFDLERDPMEMRNIADSEPELLEGMMEKLRGLVRERHVYLGGIMPSGKKP